MCSGPCMLYTGSSTCVPTHLQAVQIREIQTVMAIIKYVYLRRIYICGIVLLL